jgi:multidrug efflux pump subunit AcrB
VRHRFKSRLQFDRSRTVVSAAQDVQAAINATAGQLPLAESCAGLK